MNRKWIRRSGALICGVVVAIFAMTMGTASVAAQPLFRGGVVLAMGDSYNVGVPLNQPLASTAGCARQTVTADRIVANTIGYSSHNVSCAGATVGELLGGRAGEPPQVDAITPRVRVILLSAGGNDGIGPSTLARCILPTECTPQSTAVRRGLSGIARLWNATTQQGSLAGLYATIKQRMSPGTRVLVAGYPVMISPSVRAGEFPGCTQLISVAERQMINRIVTALNTAIRQAATAFGFDYVDTLSGLDPRLDVCSTRPDKPVAALEGPVPLHPTLAGVDWQAARYTQALAG